MTNFEYLYEISNEETRYRLDERAAIQEYDGHLPRPEAEARAVDEVFPLPNQTQTEPNLTQTDLIL